MIDNLTTKQDSFCIHYTTIGADTFSNGTKSAIAAGYSKKSAYSQASTLLKNPKIQERIKELHSENMSRNSITVDKVLADLEHDKLSAREHKNYSVAVRCTELQGRFLEMFTDKHAVKEIGTRTLTKEQVRELLQERPVSLEDIKDVIAT